MTDKLFDSLLQIALAITGIAILAVLVSKNAQTPQVISSAGGAFAQDISAAVSPVTGGGFGTLGATGGFMPGY